VARIKPRSISAPDLAEFVEQGSDFSFEMLVLRTLRRLGFDCSHGGTYQDPVTQKGRQFDIHAERLVGESHVALAVECKNIQEHAPLMLSTVPRTSAEAFHQLMYSPHNSPFKRTRSESGDRSFYLPGLPVAKRIDQVSRNQSGVLTSDDSATWEKLSQAVNSCHGLIERHAHPPSSLVTAIVPVLVVPPQRLWRVDYDANGQLTHQPHLVAQVELFLDRTWTVPGYPGTGGMSYRLSHLEILTFDALKPWTERCWDDEAGLFPTPKVTR